MKLKNISLMNVFMCFCVIIIHITSYPIENSEIDKTWVLILFCINKFLRFAVPCFVFLSGYKLYRRYKNEKIDIKKFYFGRLKKIVIPYIICYIIYFFYFYNKGWIGFSDFMRGLVTGRMAAHFYYVIFTIQLYILFPLILILFEKNSNLTLAISCLSTIIMNQVISFKYDYLIFVTWILYFVFGMYVAKYEKEKVNKKAFVFELLGFSILSIFMVYINYKTEVLKEISIYYPPLLILCSIFASVFFLNLFKIITSKEHKALEAIVNFFDPNTYYIFLYHVFFIEITQFDIIHAHLNTPKTVFLGQILIVFWAIMIMCVILNFGRKMLKKAKNEVFIRN